MAVDVTEVRRESFDKPRRESLRSRRDSFRAIASTFPYPLDKPKEVPSFEDVLELTGGFGLFQFLVLLILLIPEIPAAFVAFAPVFVGKSPTTWYCMDANNVTEGYELPSDEICNCTGTLRGDNHESTMVSEWGLVCGAEWVSEFITSVQMMGMLIGSLIASQISDWYGRKKVYIMVCVFMAAGQLISAFAPNPYVFAAARFIGGFGIAGIMGMSIIYSMEFLTSDFRLLTGSLSPWGEGIMLFALLAYYFRDWRQLMWISSVPFIVPLITVPFLPESPRWLIRNKKFDEALAAVRVIQRVNGTTGIEVTREMLEEIHRTESGSSGTAQDEKVKRFSYLDFFRQKDLRKKTLLLMGIWFAYALVYFGISYNIKNMRGDPYWNVFFMGLSDAVGYPAALLLNNRIGRRKSLIIFMVFGATLLVALAVVDIMYGREDLSVYVTVGICLTGKFGVSGARSAARILTSETFPTAVRTMGYGLTGMLAGLGGIIAPQVVLLGALWWQPLPFLVFAVISVAGSLLALVLPETAGQSLQERMGSTKAKNIEIGGGGATNAISLDDEKPPKEKNYDSGNANGNGTHTDSNRQ